ncbi:MAG: hypothetical protein AMS23_11005 [Bacteroides sp. SM1_62]|nr:MAG: hypothetical protein AMS26_19385 [Bacteroides sp. SM23_62]KPL20418.1 MAG: hypothetical protein AMS23_11005 [Bacteroides sp. SM1_62]
MKIIATENSKISNLSDCQLWIELRRDGNPDVLHALFYRFYDDLYFYGSKLVKDNDLILDTIQDVFSILWEDRKRLSDVQNVKAYLFKTFRNKLLKTSHKNVSFFFLMDIRKIPENESILSPEDIIIEKENRSEISKTISDVLVDLTDKQKEILYLRFKCNLSIAEIGQTLSIKKQSVSNLLHRTINKLRRKL